MLCLLAKKHELCSVTPLDVFQIGLRIPCSCVHAYPVILLVKRHEINNFTAVDEQKETC